MSAAAAAVVVIGVGALLWPRDGDDQQAFAAEAVAVAEANPRLLVARPGWSVTRADEFTVTEGEMTFSDGDHELDVHWRAATDYEDFLDDRASGNRRTSITVLGQQGAMFQYGGSTDFTTLLPPTGVNFVEIRGDLGSEAAYREILASLQQVDVDTWLSAMPPSVVKPDDRNDVVAEMLAGIPLPPGFDAAGLEAGNVQDRYQLGAQVAGSVACAWFDQWHHARRAGDTAGAQRAVDAMQSAREWPILIAMNAEGDYPEVLWEYANRMRHNKIRLTEVKSGLGCTGGVFDTFEGDT